MNVQSVSVSLEYTIEILSAVCLPVQAESDAETVYMYMYVSITQNLCLLIAAHVCTCVLLYLIDWWNVDNCFNHVNYNYKCTCYRVEGGSIHLTLYKKCY